MNPRSAITPDRGWKILPHEDHQSELQNNQSRPRPAQASAAFTVSIDTEEDNWLPARAGITAANVLELPRLAERFQRLGIRATYFVTYQAAIADDAAAVLRAIHAAGDAEIGAHLHPWNTPPDCGLETTVSMLKDYPADVQERKVRALVSAITSRLQVQPRAFRAGRFGFGESTARALLQNDLHVDSSVTPMVSWKHYDNGPSYLRAPLSIYRFAEDDALHPAQEGTLVEVPVSVGCTRFRPALWSPFVHVLESAPVRKLRLGSLAGRMGLFQRVILSPETSVVSEMVRASRRLVQGGTRHLHMFLHSSSLVPGLTPFARSRSDVQGIFDRIEQFVAEVSRFVELDHCTVSEAATRFAPRADLRVSLTP